MAKNLASKMSQAVYPQNSNLGPFIFLMFIKDLPKKMQEVEFYRYADDFIAIARNQNDMNKATETIHKWLETSKLEINTRKSQILNIKERVKAKFWGERSRISQVKTQLDLGLIIQQDLGWNTSCLSRFRKTMSAFFQIKCILSSPCDNFQHLATNWILDSNQSYRNPLVTLKLLPLSLNVEMHRFLLLLFLIRSIIE